MMGLSCLIVYKLRTTTCYKIDIYIILYIMMCNKYGSILWMR